MKVASGVMAIVASLILLTGCASKQYDLGTHVEVTGHTATLYVMRWEVVGSGTAALPEDYVVDWGDGTISYNRDGKRIDTHWRWVHTYENPGQYRIYVSGSGTVAELSVAIE